MVGMAKLEVRARLMNRLPTDLHERLIYAAGPGAGPVAHATRTALCHRIVDGGSSCERSTLSASERRAMANALFTASCSLVPYANAPGTSGTSAVHRPSTSCSVSMLSRKSSLLVLCGGLRVSISSLGCTKADFVACDRGHQHFRRRNGGSIN